MYCNDYNFSDVHFVYQRIGLCCKSGVEYEQYYSALERTEGYRLAIQSNYCTHIFYVHKLLYYTYMYVSCIILSENVNTVNRLVFGFSRY